MYKFTCLLAVLILQVTAGTAATSVSQYGITWTFDKDYTVGHFVNGDWYVVGPVEIQSVSPAPTSTRNGSVVNPVGGKQGYDDRGGGWDAAEMVSFPLTLQTNQSLVSSISRPETQDCSGGWTNYAGSCRRGIMETQAVLTCLSAAPSEPSFRPPYAGDSYKPVFPVSDINWDLLPKLASPPIVPDVTTILRQLQRPWIDHQNGWTLQYTHASDNHQGYGRDMANQISPAACYVLLDEPDVDSVAIRLIQIGIDNYGVTEAGGYWPNDGGHALGRKFPIVFAARMLGDATLASIGEHSGSALYADGYGIGNPPPGFVPFGEDGQTFYVTKHPDPAGAWDAGTDEDYDIYVPDGSGNYRLHSKSDFSWYGHGDASKDKDFLEYTDEHQGMPEWGIRHSTEPNRDGLDWDAPYRNGTNGDPYEGFVLAAHILGMKGMWNHDPLFDYTDRFIAIDGTPASFVGFMWTWYRAKYGCVWKRTDTGNQYSNGALDCTGCEYNCNNTAIRPSSVPKTDMTVSVRPNPSDGNSAVNFIISRGSETSRRDVSTHNKIAIYSATGDLVFFTRINDGLLQWDGCDNTGRMVDAGIYFYTVSTESGVFHGRIMRME